MHKTAIVLHHKERSWVGWTRDISAHGMQIELEEPFDGEKGDIITVALPRLQELARNMDLQRLPYRLVSLNLNSGYQAPMPRMGAMKAMAMAEAAPPPDIEAGSSKVSVSADGIIEVRLP